jgi:hypothetical protein
MALYLFQAQREGHGISMSPLFSSLSATWSQHTARPDRRGSYA